MSAPVIFIIIPILLGGILWIFSRRVTLTSVLASFFSLIFALLAGLLPIDKTFMLGSNRIEIPAELNILGRQLVLDQQSLSAVILLFTLGAFWFLGIRPARAPRRMAPLGMILLGLAVATLAVRPFLYSAIILEALTLVSVPLLVPAGRTAGRGIVRYIIFMTLAMPLILLAGALAGQLELNPSGSNLIVYAVLSLGLGFAIWLAVFPLNTWVPMLAEDTPPFVMGFLLSIQSTIALLMLMKFIGEFSWLSNYPALPILLRTAGLLTVAAAGVWAAFQTDLNRLFGFSIVAENGLALMMLSLPVVERTPLFTASLLPRLVGIAVLALSLAALRKAGVELTIKGMEGAIFRNPSLVLALFVSYFSLAGLPLLASFPVRLVLFEHLADVSLQSIIWVGIGIGGLLLSGFRLIFSATRSEVPHWVIEEDRLLAAMLILGVVLLLVMGLFPSFSLDWIATRL